MQTREAGHEVSARYFGNSRRGGVHGYARARAKLSVVRIFGRWRRWRRRPQLRLHQLRAVHGERPGPGQRLPVEHPIRAAAGRTLTGGASQAQITQNLLSFVGNAPSAASLSWLSWIEGDQAVFKITALRRAFATLSLQQNRRP